jgi:hypothetical protein
MRESGARVLRVFCVLLVATLSLLAAGDAVSGSLDFMVDLDTPAAKVSPNGQREPIDTRDGLAFGLGYSSRPAFAPGGALRFGAVVGRRSLTTSAASAFYDGFDFTELRLQARAMVDVLRRSRFVFSTELALGLSFLSDNIPCNEMFCELPESATIATPAVRASIKMSRGACVLVSIRYPAYLNDWESTFPFRSGIVVGLGVEVAGAGGQ